MNQRAITKLHRKSLIDYASLARSVRVELAVQKPMTPAEFVELVALKLAVIGAKYQTGDIARNVVAAGENRYWLWNSQAGAWTLLGCA